MNHDVEYQEWLLWLKEDVCGGVDEVDAYGQARVSSEGRAFQLLESSLEGQYGGCSEPERQWRPGSGPGHKESLQSGVRKRAVLADDVMSTRA
jgi:hypothetical protein